MVDIVEIAYHLHHCIIYRAKDSICHVNGAEILDAVVVIEFKDAYEILFSVGEILVVVINKYEVALVLVLSPDEAGGIDQPVGVLRLSRDLSGLYLDLSLGNCRVIADLLAAVESALDDICS